MNDEQPSIASYYESQSDFIEPSPLLDKRCIWITAGGDKIDYAKLTTQHIKNIINMFEFTSKNMPNLFKELEERVCVNTSNLTKEDKE